MDYVMAHKGLSIGSVCEDTKNALCLEWHQCYNHLMHKLMFCYVFSVLTGILAVWCMSQEAVHFELIDYSQKQKQQQKVKKKHFNN